MNLKFKYYSVLFISALLVIGISCDDDDDDGGSGTVGDNAVTLDLVAEGLASPVAVMESPDNSGRLFIVDQAGQIYIHQNGALGTQPFLDISNKVIPREKPSGRTRIAGLGISS